MTGKETKRLSKVAREFNVGISTIVDFLNKKGFDISSNPNNRISDEAYSMLQKEYSSDISLKKESEKLNLRAHRLKNESVSIEDLKHEEESDGTTESDEEEVIITDLSSNSRPKKIQEEKPIEKEILPENPHQPLIEEKIKVVGKIDLDNISHKPVSDKEQQGEKTTTSQPKKSTEIKNNSSEVKNSHAESKVTDKNKPVHKEKASSEKAIPKDKTPEQDNLVSENKATLKPEKEVKGDTIPAPSIEVKEEPEQVQSVQQEIQEKQPAPEKIILQKKTEAPTHSKNINQPQTSQQKKTSEKKERDDIAEEKTTNVPEFIETNVPKIEDEIKVIGKIDLESLNQKTRPAKKSKKQKEEERRDRIKVQRDATKSAARESPQGSENGETKTDTAANNPSKSPNNGGGKFDLQLQKKKVGGTATTAAEDEEHRKKRRKRIPKDGSGKERVNVAVDGRPTPIHPNTDPNRRAKKPPLRPIPGNRRHLIKKEVNEVDVQKQIKDTLARLTSKTKSKGSKYRREKRQAVSEKMAAEQERIDEEKNILKATEFVSVNELATMMNVPVTQVIATCMSLGMFVSINQRLDAETLTVVADEFGYKVEFVSAALQDSIEEEIDTEEELITRPPIVTVMGHVDHGKTSLLDYIRKANVVSGEAGGITQHIGAYSVKLESGRRITFLDTPGHEAFTAMRARGAEVTDIAIIIIAADDNIMPQTIEAINHAQAAGVPIVFAINKIDKPGANPEKIKEALANMNMLVEEWGGKYQSQDISAKNGIGIKELLEKVVLEAEMLELKANPEKRAIGSVIESSLDKGRGYVATVLIKSGTLKIGDMVLAGQYYGHIKAMFNERNQHVEEAGPSDPVLILGLNGAPQAGDKFNVLENEKEARLIANKREQFTTRTRSPDTETYHT